MAKKQKVQWQDILSYMQMYGSITSMEAWDKFHATRLAAVIFNLRNMGYDIETRDCVGKNEYGTYNYAKYVYHGWRTK